MNFTLLIFDTSLASSGICNNVTSALFLATDFMYHNKYRGHSRKTPPVKGLEDKTTLLYAEGAYLLNNISH